MPLPTQGRVTQIYGPTAEELDSGYNGYPHFNKGVDISAPAGSPVQAMVSGTVVAAGDQGDGWGVSLKIRDDKGFIHNYGHLSHIAVQQGMRVDAGTIIGAVGSTGFSTGPHLSYDVKSPSGEWVDPSPWVGFNAAGDNRNADLGALNGSAQQSGTLGGGIADVPPEVRDAYREYYDLLGRYYMFWVEGAPMYDGQPAWETPPPEVISRFIQLEDFLGQYQDQNGPGSVNDVLAWYDYLNATDPGVIDAQNAANDYARQLGERQQAAEEAATRFREQIETADLALGTQQAAAAPRETPTSPGSPFYGTPPKLYSGDELFSKALDDIRNSLPEVPDLPYPQRPPNNPLLPNGPGGMLPPEIAPPETGTGTGTSRVGLPPGTHPGQPGSALGEQQQTGPGNMIPRNTLSITPEMPPMGPRTPARNSVPRAASRISEAVPRMFFGLPRGPEQSSILEYGNRLPYNMRSDLNTNIASPTGQELIPRGTNQSFPSQFSRRVRGSIYGR